MEPTGGTVAKEAVGNRRLLLKTCQGEIGMAGETMME